VRGAGKLRGMTFLADAALDSTIGLVFTFFILLPLLAHGLIGVAVAVGLGERQDNQAYARGEDVGPSQG
jgi:succinate dehydrogenase/fumarate reductase cytochrome b subunit